MRVLTFVVTCDYIDFWTLCFAHHFVYCCHFTRFLIKFFACLYLTTMQILWAQKYKYGVLFITHAREIFKSIVFDSWLENSSSICFPPHSIYTSLTAILKWYLFGSIVMWLSFMFCLTSQYLGLQNRQSSLEELKVHLEVYNAKAYFMIWENITYSHYCSRVRNRRRAWKVWQKTPQALK